MTDLPAMRARSLRSLTAVLGVVAALLPLPAVGLTTREATIVVDLIEALQPELGKFAYSEGIAQDWFEQDTAGNNRIAKAGFTAKSWDRALGETVKGFWATLSDVELEEMFSGLKAGIAALPQLSAAQKEDALRSVDEQIRELLAMRAQGQAFADAVRPLEPRLRRLMRNHRE
jgi:hypothetical protein